MVTVPEIFGTYVFNDSVMKERLREDIYHALQKTIHDGKALDPQIADAVAEAMKDWAVERGATHYTHWFQPMTDVTAGKHDSFISPTADGHVIMEFRGKELIKGEPDASSFPSGGLRATFEARGYTAWDPTSYAFVKDGTLYIPTAFCSYNGAALDKKTPLLRSMEAISEQAVRVLRLFGHTDCRRVIASAGPEQEYFLVDKELFDRRKDLVFCGRTLFGAQPPRGQDMDDHYFGVIQPRVAAYMKELDEELWKLGVSAKTKHNEAAPAQYELAPIFSVCNIAADHNQLIMELMKTVATRHGLVCLLHEKPFDGVNGSGKHNNWSLGTDTGINLFKPGKTPAENAQFLLFLAAVIKAVDEHQDLLRISVASAGNDHRLGGGEAPPAIISIFLGDELTAILDAIVKKTQYAGHDAEKMRLGVDVLPAFPRDNTDRNRTSPLAFTGNRFEFRMLGSSASVADPNIALNTIVADALKQFADELEQAEDFTAALNALIRRTIKQHQRIIFNGDGYADEWQEEAARRGLLNLPSTVDALPYMLKEENIRLYVEHKVYNRDEIFSRHEVMLDIYRKIIKVEARTMADMARREIYPAVNAYLTELCEVAQQKQAVSSEFDCTSELEIIRRLSAANTELYIAIRKLEADLATAPATDLEAGARYDHDVILSDMQVLRRYADAMERETAENYWPLPTYGDLMFGL